MSWVVLVPLKPVHRAKSRLGLSAATRALVATAMAQDTVAAALAAADVARVVVVTSEPAPWMPEVLHDAGGGLSAAVAAAARQLVGAAVAVLPGDLPALRPGELGSALVMSWEAPSSVVADAPGTGTVLLTARPGVRLRPSYGIGSLARHVALGADDVTATVTSTMGPAAGLFHDVDTPADWAAALARGVGPATLALGDLDELRELAG